MKYLLSVLLALSSVAYGQNAYELSSGIEEILSGPISQSFNCDNRPYGYYADTANNCELFHVCLPIPDDTGALIETAQYSFACGEGSVFNQESLTCAHLEDAVPCSQAESLYDSVNAEFGKIAQRKRK